MDLSVKVGHIAQLCLKLSKTIAVAESCTGGLLAATLTETAGASNWFNQGWVCYNNAAKQQQLNCSQDLLREYSAVSDIVAMTLAANARMQSKADVALSITGYAGPAVRSSTEPVGLVYLGIASDEVPQGFALQANFEGNRASVRMQSVDFALDLLWRELKGGSILMN